MAKINSTTVITKQCISCGSPMDIKVYNNPNHPDYGNPIVKHKSKISCSHACHTHWQKSMSWEERIGKEKAEEIREARRADAKSNNPSTRPGVAAKISTSLKQFLLENPDARRGENNSFFGHKHTQETIERWKITKTGKRSYNEDQKSTQTKNTPKKESHPNWQGGIANGEYGHEFNQALKTHVKESYNQTCQLCNATGVDLDVHHIDYDKKNNSAKNLIPLCKTCHGKTNYNREKWQKLFESYVD